MRLLWLCLIDFDCMLFYIMCVRLAAWRVFVERSIPRCGIALQILSELNRFISYSFQNVSQNAITETPFSNELVNIVKCNPSREFKVAISFHIATFRKSHKSMRATPCLSSILCSILATSDSHLSNIDFLSILLFFLCVVYILKIIRCVTDIVGAHLTFC